MLKKNEVSPENMKSINGQSMTDKILIGTKEVSRRYDVPEGTLNQMAYKRTGPKFYKVGSRRLYEPKDCDSFFKSNPVLTIDQC